MQVYLLPQGTLKTYFDKKMIEITLHENATVKDLLAHIGQDMGSRIPDFLWNKAESRFRGPVVITIDKKVVSDLSVRLLNGQEIHLYKALVGG